MRDREMNAYYRSGGRRRGRGSGRGLVLGLAVLVALGLALVAIPALLFLPGSARFGGSHIMSGAPGVGGEIGRELHRSLRSLEERLHLAVPGPVHVAVPGPAVFARGAGPTVLHAPGASAPEILFLGRAASAQEPDATGQEADRRLVAHEVSVSRREATLRLEFADGERLEASIRDGTVTVGGEELGTVEAEGAVAGAWRSLLGELAAMGSSRVGERLREWELPTEAEGAALEAAEELRQRLARTVADTPAPGEAVGPALQALEAAEPGQLARLLQRGARLQELSRALEGLPVDDLRLHVGEDVRVGEGEVVEATVVVVDGDLVLEGTVDGHVVLLGGAVDLEEGSRVTGDLRWADGRIRGDRGVVAGSLREVEGTRVDVQPAPERATETRTRRADTAPRTGALDFLRPLRHVGAGLARLIQLAVLFGVLAVIGIATLHFAPRNLDLVARAAREDTGRSALVGLATLVLAFPVWITGIVLLAVSIIGIPLMLLWLPGFWAALSIAGLFGYLAVAFGVGEWLDRRRFEGMEWLQNRSAFQHLVTGLVVLMAGFFIAAVVQMAGPILGAVRVILWILAVLVSAAAVTVGTGAVLLTRGGRQPSYPRPGDGEPEPGFEPEPEPEPAPAGDAPPDEAHGTGRHHSPPYGSGTGPHREPGPEPRPGFGGSGDRSDEGSSGEGGREDEPGGGGPPGPGQGGSHG